MRADAIIFSMRYLFQHAIHVGVSILVDVNIIVIVHCVRSHAYLRFFHIGFHNAFIRYNTTQAYMKLLTVVMFLKLII